ncbi:uncharacterized protein LOC128867008 [Anastrepha ludens]|uniref:uncharacterized protein LOC128867008 n=1 Tax=Anastrepha ludens TaxID=28586 RepID=UPI0023AFC68B|nr:uncharacterized protein LOC128867008 [Anastrepha ludens]
MASKQMFGFRAGLCCLLWCRNLCGATLFFPDNTVLGMIFAIAVPIELPHRDVFLSYNFEANYNLPDTWGIPPIATGIEYDDIFNQLEAARELCDDCTNTTTTTTIKPTTKIAGNATSDGKEEPHRRQLRSKLDSLLTRTHFYHLLRDKFERIGYSGEPCLLRLICETNSSALGEVNGILGTLLHIIFSPTTSASENLPLSYYQAEVDGAHGMCEHYATACEENPLDLITAPLGDIIDDLMRV